jgi:hypothetical protein
VPTVLRDSRGIHYLVFHGWSDKPILRYDSTGKYLGRLGAYGKGPGEYTMTFNAFVGPDDSLFVWAGNRAQVFDSDGRYRRVARVGRATPIAVVPGTRGELYAKVQPPGFESTGDPALVRVDSTGTVRDSFPLFGTDFLNPTTPVVAPDGSIWTSMAWNYRLERHSPDGESTQLLGVTVRDWPPPFLTRREADSIATAAGTFALSSRGGPKRPVLRLDGTGDAKPKRRIQMLVDSTGLLWVARSIPAPRWDTMTITRQHLSPDEAPGEVTVPREQVDRMHHTIIEIIDPRRATVVVRTELPFLGALAAPGYVARVTADDNGHYRTEVHRLVLRRGEGPRGR